MIPKFFLVVLLHFLSNCSFCPAVASCMFSQFIVSEGKDVCWANTNAAMLYDSEGPFNKNSETMCILFVVAVKTFNERFTDEIWWRRFSVKWSMLCDKCAVYISSLFLFSIPNSDDNTFYMSVKYHHPGQFTYLPFSYSPSELPCDVNHVINESNPS